VVWLAGEDLLEVGNRCVFVLRVLLKRLSKAEVRIGGFRVDLDSVFEVLSGPLSFAKVG